MTSQAINDAIERGTSVSEALIRHRGNLFPACQELHRIAGDDGLRACMAGVVESVIAAAKRQPPQPEAQP